MVSNRDYSFPKWIQSSSWLSWYRGVLDVADRLPVVVRFPAGPRVRPAERQRARTKTNHFPSRSTHRVTREPKRNPFISPKMITTQGTWNTDTHHHKRCSPPSPKGKPSHDASIGSRTPARTGEERPKKGVVELSHLFSDSSPNGAKLEPWIRSLPDCTLSPLSPKSRPVGDPVVSDAMHPGGIHLFHGRTLTLLGTVLSTVSFATHEEF